jgi:hypothetical protein
MVILAFLGLFITTIFIVGAVQQLVRQFVHKFCGQLGSISLEQPVSPWGAHLAGWGARRLSTLCWAISFRCAPLFGL